ncbi:hypothetical protein FRB99_008120 [Tulasnella sp. 403]|nr:hypothetical protein FRB99_008120 [Tulasnella sp. 403]
MPERPFSRALVDPNPCNQNAAGSHNRELGRHSELERYEMIHYIAEALHAAGGRGLTKQQILEYITNNHPERIGQCRRGKGTFEQRLRSAERNITFILSMSPAFTTCSRNVWALTGEALALPSRRKKLSVAQRLSRKTRLCNQSCISREQGRAVTPTVDKNQTMASGRSDAGNQSGPAPKAFEDMTLSYLAPWASSPAGIGEVLSHNTFAIDPTMPVPAPNCDIQSSLSGFPTSPKPEPISFDADLDALLRVVSATQLQIADCDSIEMCEAMRRSSVTHPWGVSYRSAPAFHYSGSPVFLQDSILQPTPKQENHVGLMSPPMRNGLPSSSIEDTNFNTSSFLHRLPPNPFLSKEAGHQTTSLSPQHIVSASRRSIFGADSVSKAGFHLTTKLLY